MSRGWKVMVCALAVGAAAIAMMGVEMPEAEAQVITLEESVIKGRIQKPEAFYILQHAKLDYESLDTKPSFIDELVETVEEDPF